LEKIKDTFYKLAGDDNNILAALDGETIKKIKSLVPKVSKRDHDFIKTGMENKDLFPAIVAPLDRDRILNYLGKIDFPIPTLETFFQDILYLDVCQNVMRQLCINQPKRKAKRRGNNDNEEEEEEAEGTAPTIDESLRSQYNSIPEGGLISSAHIEVLLKRDLCDLWRFSFQYAFEMTTVKDHRRRVPRKHVDIQRAISLGLHERHNSFDLADLRHHFLWLASDRGFEVPANNESQLQPAELPRAMPSDFPPDNEDVGVERRSGKPFTDSVDADRFALSRESLRGVSDYQRVSAAFVRRSVFQAFFSYFDAGLPDSPVLSPCTVATEPSRDDIDILLADAARWGTEARDHDIIADGEFAGAPYAGVPSVPHIPMEDGTTYVEPARWDPTYSMDPLQQQNQSGTQVVPPSFRMNINSGQPLPEELLLPNNSSALNPFFEGLESHGFHIWLSEDESRGIDYGLCYGQYRNNPDSLLYASYEGGDQTRLDDMRWLDEQMISLQNILPSSVVDTEEEL
jgi:hypothetical protein